MKEIVSKDYVDTADGKVILFSGVSDATNKDNNITITLSDDCINYRLLEIGGYYQSNSFGKRFKFYASRSAGNTNFLFAATNTTVGCIVAGIVGTAMTISNSSTAGVYITGVIGIK